MALRGRAQGIHRKYSGKLEDAFATMNRGEAFVSSIRTIARIVPIRNGANPGGDSATVHTTARASERRGICDMVGAFDPASSFGEFGEEKR